MESSETVFEEIGEGAKVGKEVTLDRKIKDPVAMDYETFRRKANKYFKETDGKSGKVHIDKSGNISITPCPYTLEGLTSELGMTKDDMAAWCRKNMDNHRFVMGCLDKIVNNLQTQAMLGNYPYSLCWDIMKSIDPFYRPSHAGSEARNRAKVAGYIKGDGYPLGIGEVEEEDKQTVRIEIIDPKNHTREVKSAVVEL